MQRLIYTKKRVIFLPKKDQRFFCLYSEMYAYFRLNAKYHGFNVQKFEICG